MLPIATNTGAMKNEADSSPNADTMGFEFKSALTEGRQRFLARAIAHGLACGRRSPADFVRHFPPATIMKGLEHNPDLRAFILVSTTGIKEKIALRKSWEDSAGDLQLAVDEGETDAAAIVALFGADDCVRHLDPQNVWTFLSEGEFWKDAPAGSSSVTVAREHVA
jgi:hypothetical protein